MDKPKIKIYIDGANMFYAQKKLGWNLDWVKIKQHIETEKEILECRYYVAVKDEDIGMQKYLKYLDAIGFTVLTKKLKKINTGNSTFIFKANFDIEIATDILLDKSKVDEIVLFSGDSDFEYLIRKLHDVGIGVAVYSSKKTISWELKLAATKVCYLENYKLNFRRK